MEKPKPTITPIVIPDDKLQFLRKTWSNLETTQDYSEENVKQIVLRSFGRTEAKDFERKQ
jgi:hypothetical protein